MAERSEAGRPAERQRAGRRWGFGGRSPPDVTVRGGARNYRVALVLVRTGVPRRARRVLLAGAATGFLVLIAGQPAPSVSAQSPIETDPAEGEELSAPPTEIFLRFEEPVGDAQISMGCNGNPFTSIENPPSVSDDGLTVTAALESPPPAGDCTVAWSTTLTTGEAGADGSFAFELLASPVTTPGQTTEPAETTETTVPDDGEEVADDDEIRDASEVSDGAIWLGQVLSTFGVAVLFGALVLIVAAWPEGPEYLLAVRFLRSVWVLALVGTFLYIVALSAAVRDESFGSGLNPGGWLDLFDAGVAGQAALARLVLVIASAWVVLRPERVIDPTTQLPAIAIPTLAAVTLGLSRTAGDLAALGVIAGIAHALAMAVWIGGLVLLARVVLAGPGEEDLVHAVRGFGRISGPAIVVTVLSGLIQLYRLDGGSLFSERHGRVLLVKTVLVALMLFIGLTARQIAQTRLARATDLGPGMADRLRRAFGTEAAIGVIVIALSGWLLALDPGKLPEPDTADYPINEQFVDTTSGIDLTVSLRPGRVGMNDVRVEVDSPETDLANLRVTFVPPAGSEARTITLPIPLSGAGIAETTPGGGIPLDVAGTWNLQISATTPTGAVDTAGGRFDVRAADGSLPSSDIGSAPTNPEVTPATTPAPSTTAGG